MAEPLILMVAEKPSIAATLTEALCPPQNGAQKRKGVSPSSPVHEYRGSFMGRASRFRVTATTGHVYSLDFSQEYNNWEKHSPDVLFSAQTVRTYDPRGNIPAHIAEEARNCDLLILWLDCDREGENICFEVMELALPQMKPPSGAFPHAYHGMVYRARFSSLAPQDLQAAMTQLAHPNQNEAQSVDARQELDLRVGIAFSRLQTMYFRKHFGHQLGKQMVTYGPCQIPTLWFCVHRHVQIEAFVPEPYWRLVATLPAGPGQTSFQAHCQMGKIWQENEARVLLQRARASESAVVTSQRSWLSSYRRPRPLNTVEMLKMASQVLGLGPDDALHVAEALYLKGILSYPRTETDKYPENFDLEGTVRSMAEPNLPWAQFAQQLATSGLTAPREDGHDVGDHPPITPVKCASRSQCGSDAHWALYEEVCRHFLATVSPDATLREAEVQLQLGDVAFSATSGRMTSFGWARVARVQLQDTGAVDLSAGFQQGDVLRLQDVSLRQHFTEPPQHLTESELLALMDQHGIGTDASMASHVGNVQRRKYVQLDEQTRQMKPSELGLALCHAYMLIDPEIVLPTVRASIENACARVARGEARKAQVVEQSLRTFKNKFFGFARQIDRVPLMLAVAHSLSGRAGGSASQGRAAGQSLALWQEAAGRTLSVSLEELLDLKEHVVVTEAPEGALFDIQEVMRNSATVQQVQEALEELGFGSAEALQSGVAGGGGGQQGKGKKRSKSGKGKGGKGGWQ
ncbi:DNA topoisomerase 3-beta-1 (DNA topoisomerase III beta-1) [Durusdinium trenchii]|uniref:DNA topoisomerase n=1 Tax=Durusdinium trenchii TaxID=1381693 RepID=A0ABP0HME6_9DINO